MPRNACPTADELKAFQLGDLPEDELDSVADHLDGCARCEAAARALDDLTDPRLTPFRETAQTLPMAAGVSLPGGVGGHEILEELGRGGMGVVFKARHLRLNRVVALKMLLDGAFAEDTERARFKAEAEAVARLQHPHIVQIHDVGEHDDGADLPRPYFTLEFLGGGSLADRLRQRPQAAGQAAAWLEPLARAVHYAHTQGVVHRDLKPSNVLLAADGTPKICDFGVAKFLEGSVQRTRTGMLVGTVEYMAPEQAEGGAVGPAVDVYALGGILYALLTGRPPLPAAGTFEALWRLRNEEPVPPSRLVPGVPPDLETICLKCLQKEPHRRYATAEALAEDLRRFRAGEPILARPLGALGRAAKWARRRPAVAALLAVVALLAVGGFTLVTWQWREAVYQRGVADHKARGEAEAHRRTELALADAVVDQGIALCDRGDVGQGMLWLARGLELAVRARDADLERVARTNLAAWRGRLFDTATRLGHKDWAWTAAFSPDGATAVTVGKDCTARLWDVASGRPRGRPLRHPHPVWVVAFSPDGKTLLTGCDPRKGRESQAQLWDVSSGKPLGPPLPGSGPFAAVAFSKDGRSFLTATANEVQLWRTADRGRPVASLPHGAQILHAAFSPDGTAVVTCGTDGTARLWDAATGRPRGEPLRHRGPVEVAAFSPDGTTLATGGAVPLKNERTGRLMPGGEVRLWRWASGEPVGEPLDCGGWVRALAFGADGRTLAAGGLLLTAAWREGRDTQPGGEVRLWQGSAPARAAWRLAIPPLEHPRAVRAVALSPDGRLLLTGAEDSGARVFETATGGLVHGPVVGEGTVTAAVFRPDGLYALTGSSGGWRGASVRLWRLCPAPGPRRLGDHTGRVEALRFRPGGGEIFVTTGEDGVARLWDAATGRPYGVPMRHAGNIEGVAFSPDGKTLVTASIDRTARLWDVATGRPQGQPLPHQHSAVCAAFSPDGKTVLTAEDRTKENPTRRVSLWDAATGRRLGAPIEFEFQPRVSAFSPDGTLFVVSGNEGLLCWRSADRKPVRALSYRITHLIDRRAPAAFSPDGVTLAAADEHALRLWDYRGERVVRQWPLPEPVPSVQFSPDGKTLLLCSVGPSAQLWDVALGRPRSAPLFHPGGQNRASAFSPDSRTVAVAYEDGAVLLWDTATGKRLGPPLTHRQAVRQLAFRPDGRALVTGGTDGAVLLWPVPEDEPGETGAVRQRIEALTRMRLDERGIISRTGAETGR